MNTETAVLTVRLALSAVLVASISLASAGCGILSGVDRYHPHPIDDSAAGVYLNTGFDGDHWWEAWGLDRDPKNCDTIDSDAHSTGFKPLHGKALRITIPKGDNLGVDELRFHFAQERDKQPESMVLSYWLRFGEDFKPVLGGKMPGFGGTYGEAGWGHRVPNGEDGWSARGCFSRIDDQGKITLGYYVYYMDQPHERGDVWRWTRGNRGVLNRNQWYHVEQYIRLNTPGKADGVLRAWVDGQLAFEKSDIRFRKDRSLRIEDVWMNVYHGGAKPADHDYHLYIDDVVISQKRVAVPNGNGS